MQPGALRSSAGAAASGGPVAAGRSAAAVAARIASYVLLLLAAWRWVGSAGRRHLRAAAAAIIEGARTAAAAAAAWAQLDGSAAAPRVVRVYDPFTHSVAIAPELTTHFPVAAWSQSRWHAALRTPAGEVHCQGYNGAGQLGVGDRMAREGLVPARLPWPAAVVSCGVGLSVALRRGGAAVCSWGGDGSLAQPAAGSSTDGSVPAEVRGIPDGDRVVLLQAGANFAIAVTKTGEVYGWGANWAGQLPLGLWADTPTRITALCARGLVRLACGCFAVAETGDGDLLLWDPRLGRDSPATRLRSAAGRVALPLLDLAAARCSAAAVDGCGRLWSMWNDEEVLRSDVLPPGERVVQVAGASWQGRAAGGHSALGTVFVALTVLGALWDCRPNGARRIATAPAPQVLLPWGGAAAERIILAPEPSCGMPRCRLLLLVAGRRRLFPADPQMVRIAVCLFLVPEGFTI
eukprot:TRINITY_DN7631_c1_g1_i2.p1 TRINITY_DN7631_c1_g1~~TRINITY_DN7631_c1_g1_i2.p1  ORF type:complete len:488 (+),score=69.97 TRINITY_DN7631_c1_g1_i2:81-1466(+)